MTITALPTPPSRADDPANFSAKADTFLGALPQFATEANALASDVNSDALNAQSAATAASESASDASDAAATALAASNFKGDWSTLSGALNKPASVRHNGLFWALLNNLANVATSQPGVSADWAALSAGSMPSVVMTASVTATPGVVYINRASWVLTLPASLIPGQRIGYSNETAVDFDGVNVNGHKVRGQTVDAGLITFKPRQAYIFTYADSTTGVY